MKAGDRSVMGDISRACTLEAIQAHIRRCDTSWNQAGETPAILPGPLPQRTVFHLWALSGGERTMQRHYIGNPVVSHKRERRSEQGFNVQAKGADQRACKDLPRVRIANGSDKMSPLSISRIRLRVLDGCALEPHSLTTRPSRAYTFIVMSLCPRITFD